MKNILTLLLGMLCLQHSQAFCGFYVAKASMDLFNHASQVIMVKDGTQMTVTMYSDFHGDIKDFAMVVPVPEVLKKEQIKVIKKDIFIKLHDYTGPRLVKYNDPDYYCEPIPQGNEIIITALPSEKRYQLLSAVSVQSISSRRRYKVTVKKKYTIGGYDILILSAKKSKGLELWLKDHGYKIPEGAAEVLEPYIKSEMNFFVVKVNEEAFANRADSYLHPIQINYTSSKFMLPIRLGMANAQGDQDMVVYTFSKKGRIETTNYQTHKIPSNTDIPLPVMNTFDKFYSSVFDKSWEAKGKNGVMLEYGWNISGTNPVKCDPCPTPALSYAQLKTAGVDWLTSNNNYNYQGQVYITRLHVRYNRETFPQDLTFQETPNWENFQGRYIVRIPGRSLSGTYDCEVAQTYLSSLRDRRIQEVENLVELTGWEENNYEEYIAENDRYIEEFKYLGPLPEEEDKGMLPVFVFPDWINYTALLILGLTILIFLRLSFRKSKANLEELAL